MKTPKADYDAKVIEVAAAKVLWDAAKAISDEGQKTLDAQDLVVGATNLVNGKKKDKKTADDALAAYVDPGDLKVKQDAFHAKGKAIGDAWKAVLVKEAADTYTGADDKKCTGTATAENYTVIEDTSYDKASCKLKCTAKSYYDTTAGKSAIADGDYCYGYEIDGTKCRLYKKILAAKDDGAAGDGCYQRDSSKLAFDVFVTDDLDGLFDTAVSDYSTSITTAWETEIDKAEVARAELNMETAI